MTFIRSYEQYKKVCEIQGIEPSEENYSDIMTLTNSLLETPESERYNQTDLNDPWKEYIKNHPDVTLDDFLNSMKPQEKQDFNRPLCV